MPTVQTSDWLGLSARVNTLPLSYPRYEPDAIFTPPSDASGPLPFILLSDVVNDPARLGIDPRLSERSGTLMLSLQWPISRPVSHTALRELQGVIASHFPADMCMGALRVTSNPSCLPAYVDGAYRVAVVRVFWSSV
ncbi:MAG: phage tail terminator-like protein [Rhizorhabdus sp.]